MYLVKGTRDTLNNQIRYYFNIEPDPKTFEKTMKSQDVSFWKKAINDKMDSIMGTTTRKLVALSLGSKSIGYK